MKSEARIKMSGEKVNICGNARNRSKQNLQFLTGTLTLNVKKVIGMGYEKKQANYILDIKRRNLNSEKYYANIRFKIVKFFSL
jgi:hypothetical protein